MNLIYKSIKQYFLLSLIISLILSFSIFYFKGENNQIYNYEKTNTILIKPRTTINIDAYSAIKSSERIADIFKDLIFTSSFINKVQTTNPELDIFQDNTRDTIKTDWKSQVQAWGKYNTGFLFIHVQDKTKDACEKLSNAITKNLIENTSDYLNNEIFVDLILVDETNIEKITIEKNYKILIKYFFTFFLLINFILLLINKQFQKLFQK